MNKYIKQNKKIESQNVNSKNDFSLPDEYKISKKRIIQIIKKIDLRIFKKKGIKGETIENIIYLNIATHYKFKNLIFTFLHECYHYIFPKAPHKYADKFASYYIKDKDIFIECSKKIGNLLIFK